MPQFVLLLRDANWTPAEMSAEEIQAVIERYRQWNQRINALNGQKLRDREGRIMVRDGSKTTITDGPYAESKEVVGGFIIIEAANYDEAVRKCKDSPHLDFGSIEIREIEAT